MGGQNEQKEQPGFLSFDHPKARKQNCLLHQGSVKDTQATKRILRAALPDNKTKARPTTFMAKVLDEALAGDESSTLQQVLVCLIVNLDERIARRRRRGVALSFVVKGTEACHLRDRFGAVLSHRT